jgi:hypothetical protein
MSLQKCKNLIFSIFTIFSIICFITTLKGLLIADRTFMEKLKLKTMKNALYNRQINAKFEESAS